MSKELKIALIQSSLIWENPEENRQHFSNTIDTISSDVDLIVLPEMFTTGFTMHPENIAIGEGEKTITWMQAWADEKQAVVVGSIVFFENGKYFNRLFFTAPNKSLSHYDKKHTFTLAGEHLVYEKGTTLLFEEHKDFVISPLICYDLRFPVWARNSSGYDLLIYVANWPKPRIAAWDALLKARAIENMAYCIGVNRIGTDQVGHEYPGHSAAYDYLGNQLAFSQKEEVLYVTLDKELLISTRKNLPFLHDKDEFIILP